MDTFLSIHSAKNGASIGQFSHTVAFGYTSVAVDILVGFSLMSADMVIAGYNQRLQSEKSMCGAREMNSMTYVGAQAGTSP
jgi:hypothetical protein